MNKSSIPALLESFRRAIRRRTTDTIANDVKIQTTMLLVATKLDIIVQRLAWAEIGVT